MEQNVFDFSGFSNGIIGIIISLLSLYKWVIVIRVLISWINPDPYNPIVQFLRSVTDPAIEGVRRIVPSFLWSTGLDFTPLILILLLQVIILFLENLSI
ncbi:MAG: YggT family protein [Candidatus Latescibacterota bacterium]|jgi:YggT family protein